jgi:Uncharacterised protein family (UPF0158)
MGDWDKEAVKELRGAVYRGDSVVELVRGRLTDDVLQLAGDGLLDALAKGVEGATELARQCAAALRERWWEGDEELADQLEAALGKTATPMLRSLPVDLEELASILEGDPLYGEARIDLKTGQLSPHGPEFDDLSDEDDGDDEDRWLYVENQGSHDGYRDMERFIASVRDPDIADRLEIAITGKGAFRRFKDVLSRWPDELARYLLLRDERQRGRARAWLAAKGYRPASTALPLA